MTREGVEPSKSRRFELRRFASLRTAPSLVAQVGLEPTASLVLSQGGLPIAYRAVSVEHRGIEPRSSACKTDVFPLDERPMFFFHFSAQSRSRTCKHPGLSRVALPVGVPGHWSQVPMGRTRPIAPFPWLPTRYAFRRGSLSPVDLRWLRIALR
jgi:hypothetical protein